MSNPAQGQGIPGPSSHWTALPHWPYGVGGRTPVPSGSLVRARKCREPIGRNTMITWLSAGEGLVAAAIAVIGSVFTFTANRRAQYDRILALTAESATSPIADDRHVIGTVFEPPSKLTGDRPVLLTQDEIAALFRVLWYVQRVDALYASLHPPLRVRHIGRARALLLDSISADLEAWKGYVALDLEDPDSHKVVVTSSARGLRHLSEAYERLCTQRAHSSRVMAPDGSAPTSPSTSSR
jgi:hypothetical protein